MSLKLKVSQSHEQKCSKAVNLRVSSICGRDVLRLSNVYVLPEIPVNVSKIDLQRYPHLRQLPISQDIDCVKLLIGQDNAEALFPLQSRKGKVGELLPFVPYLGGL
jgi:hypothetical protein